MSGTSLDRSLVTGIGWTALFRWAAQIVSWGATFYTARILVPADYGIIAMAMVPIGLVRLIEDFGFDAVILQNRSLTHDQTARLGGLALVFGAMLATGLVVAAPFIADFYKEPAVAPVIVALSVVVVLDSLQIVPRVLLQRDLDFLWLGAIYCLQIVATSATLVALAMLGSGHWALAFNTIVGSAAATLLLFWRRPFAPRWPRDLRSLKGSIVSGWRMLVSRAAYYANSTADQTIAGRLLGKDALGHYSFAMTIATMPVQEITSLAGRVVPGVFSAAQADRGQLRRYFLLLTEALTYLAFPVTFGIALTAEHVVPVALGPQWDGVIVPLQALCIYMAFYTAQALVSHVLLWTGHFRHMMWFCVLSLAVLPTAFFFGIRSGGLVGLAWAWVIAYPVSSLPPMIVAWRILDLRWSQFFRALAPATSACAAMAVAVWLVRKQLGPDTGHFVALVAEAAVGAVTYVAVLALAYRSRLAALLQLIRGTRSEAAVPAASAA